MLTLQISEKSKNQLMVGAQMMAKRKEKEFPLEAANKLIMINRMLIQSINAILYLCFINNVNERRMISLRISVRQWWLPFWHAICETYPHRKLSNVFPLHTLHGFNVWISPVICLIKYHTLDDIQHQRESTSYPGFMRILDHGHSIVHCIWFHLIEKATKSAAFEILLRQFKIVKSTPTKQNNVFKTNAVLSLHTLQTHSCNSHESLSTRPCKVQRLSL